MEALEKALDPMAKQKFTGEYKGFNIEDINRQQLADYMRKFTLNYSEETILTVLRHRKYKKSTIAFWAAFLGFWNTKHTLQ